MNREEIIKEFEKRKEDLNLNIKKFNNKKEELQELNIYLLPISKICLEHHFEYFNNQIEEHSSIQNIILNYKEKTFEEFYKNNEIINNRTLFIENYIELKVEERSLLLFKRYVDLQ